MEYISEAPCSMLLTNDSSAIAGSTLHSPGAQDSQGGDALPSISEPFLAGKHMWD